MRQVRCGLAVLWVLSLVVAAGAEPAPVKVMSFNVRQGTARDGDNRWELRRGLVCELVRAEAPDVLGLQEALRFQLDELRQALPGYAEVGVGRDGGKKGEYSAILYRADRFDLTDAETFWLSDTPGEVSNTWKAACLRVCTWGRFVERDTGRAFYHYNTHLDHVSQPAREKSVRLIVDRIGSRAHPDPFVLTGDLNAGEANPAILFLLAKGEFAAQPVAMVDTFRVLYPEAKEVGTFNGFAGKADGEKIDFILAAPSTEVLAVAIVRTGRDGRYPSDHFPVTATLRFR